MENVAKKSVRDSAGNCVKCGEAGRCVCAPAVVNGKNGLVCAFCGAVKHEVSFMIGASSKADWCMIYGTGKMSCPSCYTKASAEGSAAVDKYVAGWNGQKVYTYENDLPEYIKALDRGDVCRVDEEMFYYFLEVLPPQYMNKLVEVEIDGVKYMKRCSFGFAEGAEFITDYWRGGEGVYFAKRSRRMASLR